MIFVTLDKLYHGFNMIMSISAQHLFHDNFLFYDFRVPDWNSVLPVKQQVVIKLVKKIFNVFVCKKVKFVHSFNVA